MTHTRTPITTPAQTLYARKRTRRQTLPFLKSFTPPSSNWLLVSNLLLNAAAYCMDSDGCVEQYWKCIGRCKWGWMHLPLRGNCELWKADLEQFLISSGRHLTFLAPLLSLIPPHYPQIISSFGLHYFVVITFSCLQAGFVMKIGKMGFTRNINSEHASYYLRRLI